MSKLNVMNVKPTERGECLGLCTVHRREERDVEPEPP